MTGINYRVPMERPPTDFVEFLDDFMGYDASNWVVTDTGSGTQVVDDAVNGILVCTTGATDNDEDFLQWDGEDNGSVSESWAFVAGKTLYFGMRFKLSDATETDFVAGLQVTDTSPLAVADGVYFRKDDGDTNLDFVVMASSTSDTVTKTSALANDTYYVIEFLYNGNSTRGRIEAYLDGVGIGGTDVDNMPSTELTLSFGVKAGSTGAKTLSVDWVRTVMER